MKVGYFEGISSDLLEFILTKMDKKSRQTDKCAQANQGEGTKQQQQYKLLTQRRLTTNISQKNLVHMALVFGQFCTQKSLGCFLGF